VAAMQDFFAADVKIYKTIVSIDTPLPGLRPGMSAEVRIKARQTDGPVSCVPVESVLSVGKKRLCFVTIDKEIHEREVVTGLGNEQVVEIQSGLKEGERVLALPRWVLRRLTPRSGANSQSGQSRPAPVLVRSVKPADGGSPARAFWVP